MADAIMSLTARLQNSVYSLRKREDGQTFVEYALLVGIIGIGVIAALYFLRDEIREIFSDTGNTLNAQTIPG